MRTKTLSVLLALTATAFLSACNPSGSSDTVAPSASASAPDTESATPDSGTSDSGTSSSGTTSGSGTTTGSGTSDSGSGSTGSTSGAGGTGSGGASTSSGAGKTSFHHMRAMTATERKTYEHCRQDAKDHGCATYTDKALRDRGIDPAR